MANRTARARALLVVLGLSALAAAPRARADERFFTYSYEPKVLPDGAVELEQWATVRQGKKDGDFTRWDLRTELEIGIADAFSASLYLNYGSTQSDGVQGQPDEDRFRFDGVSNEWRWKLADPVDDRLGTLLYFEWLYQGQAAELEEKLVIGKEVGDVVLAANLVFEEEWSWGSSGTSRELELVLSAGASYRLGPHLALGIEVQDRNDFPSYRRWEDSVLYAGPALHLAWGRFWATITILPQLGAPRGATAGGLDLDDDHERIEGRIIVSVEF
jgi:hypothetical protein